MISRCYSLYSMLISLAALMLFLYGFFPLNSIHFSSNENKKNHKSVDFQKFTRVVFMVIDGMRDDFLDTEHMPYLTDQIQRNNACRLLAKAETPTVTMPRVKALMMGTVPNFIDLLLNFGTASVTEDSFIHQAHNNARELLFFGDNTWLRLFPDKFLRYDGTTSFYVTDFTEVDQNITRHLENELQRTDWDGMFLHYLGLDHIGHVEGPYSSRVPPKLTEMDNVIKTIHTGLNLLDEQGNSDRSLFIICSDHGMKDKGSHGGSTYPEVHIPVVALGLSCPYEDRFNIINQIDVTATMSVLFGVPIPSTSIGVLITPWLKNLPVEKRLEVYEYNLKHLISKSTDLPESFEDLYNKTTFLQKAWLKNRASNIAEVLEENYISLSKHISKHLVSSLISFDVYALIISLLILTVVFLDLMLHINFVTVSLSVFVKLEIFLSVCAAYTAVCQFATSSICSVERPFLFVSILIVLILSQFLIILFSYKIRKLKIISTNNLLNFTTVFIFAHAISLWASSFIEEEHLTWYFIWCTVCCYFLFTSIHKGVFDYLKISICIVLLVIQRILRQLNQTEVDLADWLNKDKTILSIYFIFGLVSLFLLCCYMIKYCVLIKALAALILTITYLYKAGTGVVLSPFEPVDSRCILEAIAVLYLLVAMIIIANIRSHYNNDKRALVTTAVVPWMLAIPMLLKPHNVLLVPGLALSSLCARRMKNVTFIMNAMLHTILGWTFFYYQGNSNSFASLDIASGYVGQSYYDPITVGLLLTMHTYAMPVLAYLLLISDVLSNPALRNSALCNIYKAIALTRLFPVICYLMILIMHRSHLFVWSVFSPKLLYECSHTVIIFLCLLFTEIYLLISRGIKKLLCCVDQNNVE